MLEQVLQKIESPDCSIFIIEPKLSIDELEHDTILTSNERELYKTFGSAKRKYEWLAVRYFVAKIIGKTALIKYSPYGKPYLTNFDKKIGITHSGNLIGIALSNNNIAIDIERRSERIMRLKSRFAEIEEHQLQNSGFAPIDYFTLIWCAKETIYKLHESDDIDLTKDISIENLQIGKSTFEASILNKQRFVLKYLLINNYAIVWATDKTDWQ